MKWQERKEGKKRRIEESGSEGRKRAMRKREREGGERGEGKKGRVCYTLTIWDYTIKLCNQRQQGFMASYKLVTIFPFP